MKISFGNHALRGYPRQNGRPLSPEMRESLFTWIKQQGFDGVEIGSGWFDFYRAAPGEVDRLKQELADYGLEVVALNCLRKCVTHPAVAEQNKHDLWRAADVAKAMCARFVNVSLALEPSAVGFPTDRIKGEGASPGSSADAREEEFAAAAAFLSKMAENTASSGVGVALELHHCSLADNSWRLLQILELAGHPNLSANPDVVNLYWAYEVPEEPWYEAVERLAGRVALWHMKNVQRVHVSEVNKSYYVHAALGEGDIDYRWALARMVAAGFDGYLSIEGAGAGDLLAFASRGKAYLDELLQGLSAGIGLHMH